MPMQQVHIKKNTIIFNIFFLISFEFSSTFAESVPRNVENFFKKENIHTTLNQNFYEQFLKQVESFKQKRSALIVQRNGDKQRGTKDFFSITVCASMLQQRLVAVKNRMHLNGDRLKSYVCRPENPFNIDTIVVTEHGLIALPMIHKAHAAMGLAGNFVQAAVPIVAIAQACMNGDKDSNPANNFCPVSQHEQKKQIAQKSKGSEESKPSVSSQKSVKAKSPQSHSVAPVRSTISFTPKFSGCNPSGAVISESAQKKSVYDKPQAVKNFEAQKADDRAKKDLVVNTLASAAVVGLQQYHYQQNKTRKAKKIAQWAQEKEEDIQRRMRAGSKSRWQIEEEDRLFLKRSEQFHAEERKKQEEADKKRSKAAKKQRHNDVNRTSNSGPDKDPDEDKKKSGVAPVAGAPAKTSVDEVKKQMKYTGNPKHHINSKGNASKPPHDGQTTLEKKSIHVKTRRNGNLETRVAIENGKVVKFDEHAPGEYHGYIVEKNLDSESKNALIKAGLMKPNGKIIKR